MSEHVAQVRTVESVLPHPNADQLDLVKIAGYTTVVRRAEYKPGDLAIFIEPDTLVPTAREPFTFLAPKARADGYAKICAVRLRGVISPGLVVQAPVGAVEGEDFFTQFGLQHYEPPPILSKLAKGIVGEGPGVFANSIYDLESFRKHHLEVFEDGEKLFISEKISGTNFRAIYHQGQFFCGTHRVWRQPDLSDVWWKVLSDNEPLQKLLMDRPDTLVFGEVYGQIQKGFDYGVPMGQVRLAVFDMLYHDGMPLWMDPEQLFELCDEYGVSMAPLIAITWYEAGNVDEILRLAEGRTALGGGGHIREGVVIGGSVNRWNSRTERNKLKLVSQEYLCRK
jgi:RNA ligase (TIGR02306 family)